MPQYDFKQVTITVSNATIGSYILGGFGSGDDVISIVRDDDGISMLTGAKGNVTTSKIANPTGTANLTFQSQSPSNSILNQFANTKDSFALSMIENNSQKLKVNGNECYVLKEADNTRGKNSSERTWAIKISKLEVDE